MGQAQSMSSGTGCADCYGQDSDAPDPLRSSSGSTTGSLQSQQSTSGKKFIGFDATGRPVYSNGEYVTGTGAGTKSFN